MGEGERNDVLGAGGPERINGGLEGGAGGEDIVDDYISVCRVGVARCLERASHIFFSFVSLKRDL